MALNAWEMAGLGGCFLRIAGSERGDFASYLRSALKNGYETCPMLIIGTTGKAWQAAQSVGSRFYPIMPENEEESWRLFSEEYFPAFLHGESSLRAWTEILLASMMVEDLKLSLAFGQPCQGADTGARADCLHVHE